MSESESKVATFSPEPGPPAKQTEIKIVEIPMPVLGVTPDDTPPAASVQPARQIWTGTATAFALKIKGDFDAGLMPQARTRAAALRAACEQWERPNGTRFDPRSLDEVLRKQRYKSQGKPL